MKTTTWFTIALLIGLFLSGCSEGTTPDTSPPAAPALEGTLWQLRTLLLPDGQQLTAGVINPVTAAFQGNQISGIAACNHYGGMVEISGTSFRASNELMMTEMACQEDLMELEFAYITALTSVNTLAVHGNRLLLQGAGYQLVFEAQADARFDEPSVYLAVLREFIPNANRLIFLDETRFNAPGADLEQTLAAVSAQMPGSDPANSGIDPDTLADFTLKNSAPQPLSTVVQNDLPGEFIQPDELIEPESPSEMNTWQDFHAKFPDSYGLIIFSRVGFNQSGEQALVYYEHHTEVDTGGFYCLLSYKDKRWVMSSSFRLW